MSRILVTGGTGFIGSNLVKALAAAGHETIAADIEVDRQLENLSGFKGSVVELDTSLAWTLPHELDGKFDVVFHQAALTDPRYHDDNEIFEKNVRGFEHCLDFCESRGARLVYASTAGLYGHGPVPMKENQKKELLTSYGKSKWAMDQIAESWFTKFPIVGLRYFNVFGPQESGKGRPASMIYHLGKQIRETNKMRLFKHGEQRRDHIYVKDVVRANLLAMNAVESGIFNVGTGKGTTFNELAKVLNEVLGTAAPIEYFDMPYDRATYQADTVADMTLAEKWLRFRPEWDLKSGIADYFKTLGWI